MVDIKRKYSEVSPDEYTSESEIDESCLEKLNRYAEASLNSSEDPSFHVIIFIIIYLIDIFY